MPTRPPVHRAPHLPTPAQAREAYDRHRGSAARRGYDAAWRLLRDAVLRDEPHCRACKAVGHVVRATMVHHVQPVRERPDLRLARSNQEPLCAAHHAQRHAAERR